MTIAYVIKGSRVVIPGVYANLIVENNLPEPAPAGRSVFILGEAEEGVPGSELDLKKNYFQKFQDVKNFYKSGPIVDAARMLFSRQPSPIFTGSIDRLYIYKTNSSERAEHAIASPASFGSLVATSYGEAGNTIKEQILDAQSEIKPVKTMLYLPSAASKSFTALASGKSSGTMTLAAHDTAAELVTAINTAAFGVTASGGAAKTALGASIDADLSASGDTLTISKTGGSGTFSNTIAIGDVCYIQEGTVLAGASDENAGSYVVTSINSTNLSIKMLKKSTASGEANSVAFDLSSVTGLAAADLKINAPVTLAITAATKTGTGATMELLAASADKSGLDSFVTLADFSDLLGDATSSIASISATVPAAGQISVSIDTGTWAFLPKVGDVVQIARTSLLAGATLKNVGMFVVSAANYSSLTLVHLHSGMTTEEVASVVLAGANDTLKAASSYVSTSYAARRLDSASERKVKLSAVRDSDGSVMNILPIGGNPVLEMGYYTAGATACTVSITATRQMIITPTGAGTTITIPLLKYKTLKDLVSFLNTKTGVSARLANAQFASISPSALDMVDSADCLAGQTLSAFNCRVKKDYSDWKQYFEDNFGIVTFREGTMNLKAGLPSAESLATYLSGAVLGSSSNASFQAGFDAALKINVRFVVPLASRDAAYDILDGLTDPNSSYTIGAINAQAKAHVSTASGIDFQRRRMAFISFDGQFEAAKAACSDISFERCQMTFQRHLATNTDGDSVLFLPWMSSVAAAAARCQAIRGTSLLRKPFLLSSAEHTGENSLYTDTLVQQFDPDDKGMLSQAIEAGLLTFREVPGFGVRLESPDSTTRSRDNDPQAWVWERASVINTLDEYMDTVSSVLDSYIGSRTSDVSISVIKKAIADATSVFLPGTGDGSLEAAQITDVVQVGVKYKASCRVKPTEAVEAIELDVYSTRTI